MRRQKRHNKYGASTVFMAIILSALVIVETVFLTLVSDMNRRMELSRALKCQAESILAGYDRDLFRVYGIYAFGPDKLNDEVFCKVLAANSAKDLPALECTGTEALDDYALRKAIISYYSYRTVGMLAKESMKQLSGLAGGLESSGLLAKIKEYRSSGAAGYLSDILSGAVDIEGVLSTAGESYDLSGLNKFVELLDDCKDDVTSYDGGFDLFDMASVTDLAGTLEKMTADIGDGLFSAIDHVLIAHYAAFNFDCVIDNKTDKTITGTSFTRIHGKDYCDSEYIMTGSGGKTGSFTVSTLIFATLFAKEFLSNYTDSNARARYKVIAVVLSVVIGLLSAGTVIIQPDILETVIIVIVSICGAAKSLKELKKGGTVSFIEKDGVEFIKLGYRDFMFLFTLFTPDSALLPRMLEVLGRDYGELYTGIKLETEYGGTGYDITKSYVMYE